MSGLSRTSSEESYLPNFLGLLCISGRKQRKEQSTNGKSDDVAFPATTFCLAACPSSHRIICLRNLPILDFRFWILDCSIIGLLYPLAPARLAESSSRSA